MSRAVLLSLLLALPAAAQTFPYIGGGSGGGGVCTLDGSTQAIATSYRATTTTGTGYQCDAVLSSCIDLGPGANNFIGTNVAGDIVLGPGSGNSAVVRIFGTQYVNNFVQSTAGFDVYFNGALFNSFTGQPLKVADAEGLTINGTTAIKGVVRASVTFDFPSIPNGSCGVSSLTVTGAAVGDYVSVNADFALPSTVGIGNARVTAANTVDLRLCNYDAALPADPASGAYLFRLER